MRQLLVVFAFVAAAAASAAMRVDALRCEYGINPLGIDVERPRLFWQVQSDGRGARQTAWQVIVATTPQILQQNRGDLWDSGKVEGDATTFVGYAGKSLRSSQRVFWKVRVWDENGQPSAWSSLAQWTMGILHPEEWTARWISSSARMENLLVRTEFAVKPGLVRALTHVSGLGQYELFLNGSKEGDDVLAPGWTDYRKTILYDTRDVTSLLHEGRNAVGLALGNGMYHVVRPPGRFAKFVGSHGQQRAIVQLRLEYADGSVENVVTDPSWRVQAGPITFSGIYGGEDFDARRVEAGWNRAGFDDSAWERASVVADDLRKLRGFTRASERVVPIENRRAKSVRTLANGAKLYDFGQNTSFMPELHVSGPAGSRVRMTAGEVVNEDGTINRSTMGGAHRGSAWWEYTKATENEEVWFPQFYYVGSRYLYVELFPPEEGGELPEVERISMVVVHADVAPAGEFRSSDETLNRIRDLVRWAQRSNMVSILTDCPHREKLGWLEQVHLNGPALRYEWDVTRLMAKAERDMADAQTEEGLVPNIAPEYTVFKGTFRAAAEWGASFIMVPWQQYRFNGDTGLMREQYGAMKRYYSYLESRAGDGLLDEGLGDWYDHVLGKPGRANLTPGGITGTAHLFQNAKVLAQMGRILGHDSDAADFEARAERVARTFNRELFKPDTPELYGTGSHTSLALPLAMGIAPTGERDRIFEKLVADIEARGHATSGAVGFRYLLHALAEGKRNDLILRLATNEAMPGYAYQLKQGATALAESWTAQLGASQNHFFLGQIIEWFYADLAGLRSDPRVPGFKHAVIKPHPLAGIEWVEAHHDSLHGRHAVRWQQGDDGLALRVSIPANTTAKVLVPASSLAQVKAPQGARHVGDGDGRVIFEIESGEYEFLVAQ